MSDILGQALFDFYQGNAGGKLWIHNRYGKKEEMPVSTYFRPEDDMPDLEYLAMEQCRGKVLDIGAGAGSHALLLQEQCMDVTAIDISPMAVEVMWGRGVRQVFGADIFNLKSGQFDTLLLLMNGIGLAGTVANLKSLLMHFHSLLKEDGQVLFDSSDIAYLYNDKLPEDSYYGEIWYQYEYRKQKGEWFRWLYIDENTMEQTAAACGFDMEVLIEDDYGQYLARLTRR